MLRPDYSRAVLLGLFLLFAGGFGVVARVWPQAPAAPGDRAHAGRRSLFGPVLALVLAALILLHHWEPAYPLGAWIASYWPLLLIVWGLVRLLEHYTREPRRQIGFSGGELLLVVIIIIVGLTFSGAYRFGHSRWGPYWGWNMEQWNPLLERHHFSASASADLAGVRSVRIEGQNGDVRLVASAAQSPSTKAGLNLQAQLDDSVRADGAQLAQQRFEAAQPVLQREGNELVVMPAGGQPGADVRADLTLTLPATLPVTVHIASGDVSAQDWQANLAIDSQYGSVTLGRIRGNLAIHAGHGSVSLDHVTGSVEVHGAGDNLALSNIDGPTVVEGGFVGSVSFHNLLCQKPCRQSLWFQSPRSRWALAALPGSLSDDMGQISVEDASRVELHTRDEEVDVRRFSGPLVVSTRNRPVIAVSRELPNSPVSVQNENADITLELPRTSQFRLQAAAQNGSVKNGFGTSGSGALLDLQTTNGTITVRPAE